MDKVLKKLIKCLIEEDKDTRDIFKKILKEVVNDDWKYFLNKIGYVGGSIILIVIGSGITLIFEKIFK